MKTSARALLAVGALLVFLIGLGLVLVFAPRNADTSAFSAAKPGRGDAAHDGAPASVGGDGDTREARTAAVSEQPGDAPPLDDLFALLAWLEKAGRGPLPEVVGDSAKFEAYFASQNREHWVDAAPYLKRLHDPLAPGVVLQIEPGVWKIEAFEPQSGPFPPDVTVAGSGTNRTLLLLGGIRPVGSLARFTLRDCTVFTDSQALFEMPGGLASITFERARLIGFDSGVGNAVLIRARGLGIVMRDCEIAGGYGRAPGQGTLFDVPSAALLARCERCKFSGLRLGAESWNTGASAALVECTALALLDDPQASLATHAGIAATATTFVRLADGARPPALDIDGLFADWRALTR
jgi:hypothetical protein